MLRRQIPKIQTYRMYDSGMRLMEVHSFYRFSSVMRFNTGYMTYRCNSRTSAWLKSVVNALTLAGNFLRPSSNAIVLKLIL